jgi:hypothetical protein
MATKIAQHFLYCMAKGEVNVGTDIFKIILMSEGYSYNRTHSKYSDISAFELATGNGYTQFLKDLSGVNIVKDDTLYKAVISWATAQWTASGGNIGPACGAHIIDDTHIDDIIVGYIDFGGSGVEPDGGTFSITTPTIELAT